MSRERQILQMALLAGLAGAGLGLLLAPKPGQELRHDLEGWLERARERLNPGEIERTVTHFVRNTLDQTEGIVKSGQSVIENKLHALLSALEAGKHAYEDELRRFEAEDKSLNGSDRVSRAG